MPSIIPAEGSQSNSMYLIEYNEDQWLKYSDDQKQFCYDTWIKKAEPLSVTFVTLRLMPDPIFPINGRTKPYVEWQHRFDRKAETILTVNHALVAIYSTEATMTPAAIRERDAILATFPSGTWYEIWNGTTIIDKGVVHK